MILNVDSCFWSKIDEYIFQRFLVENNLRKFNRHLDKFLKLDLYKRLVLFMIKSQNTESKSKYCIDYFSVGFSFFKQSLFLFLRSVF